jgi:hypothetical protein
MPVYVGITALNRSSNLRVPAVAHESAPASPAAGTPVAGSSSFTAGTYYWKVTALGDLGETTPSTQVTATVANGDTVTLTWSAVPFSTGYRVYRGTSSNGEDHYFFTTTNSFTDTGAAGTAGTPPGTNTALHKAPVRPQVGQVAIVDVDDVNVRKALHGSIGQWVVSATNASYRAANGSITSLPSNS